MKLIINTGNYSEISITYPTTISYYVAKFLSDTVTLQEDNITYGKVFKAGELAVKYEYLISMKSNTNGYWKPEKYQQILIVSKIEIVHTCLNVSVVTDVADISGSHFSRKSFKNKYQDIQYVPLIQITIIS